MRDVEFNQLNEAAVILQLPRSNELVEELQRNVSRIVPDSKTLAVTRLIT